MTNEDILKQLAEVDEAVEKLVAANQELGTKIDAIRDERRNLIGNITKLQARRALLSAMMGSDALRNAVVEGQMVEVSGKELIAALNKAVNG